RPPAGHWPAPIQLPGAQNVHGRHSRRARTRHPYSSLHGILSSCVELHVIRRRLTGQRRVTRIGDPLQKPPLEQSEDDAGEDEDPHRSVASILEPFMHQRASNVVIAASIDTDLAADATGFVEALLSLLAGQSYAHWGTYKR